MRIFDAAATRAALPFERLVEALQALFAQGCEVPARHVHEVPVPGGVPPALPAAPRDLRATQVGGRVVLEWNGFAIDPVPTTHRVELGSAPGLSDLGVFDTGSPASFGARYMPRNVR